MNDPFYREVILEHWEHPQNYGVLAGPDIDISETNPLCGDEIRFTVKVKNRKVEEILFVSTGCAISKAAASLLTQKVKGMRIGEIVKIKPEEFLATFKIDFSPARVKCALLGFSTLKKALGKKQ